MQYALINNGAVEAFPYSESQLRRDNPNTSFPRPMTAAVLERNGVFPVVVDTLPAIPFGRTVDQVGPNLVGDTWTLEWVLRDKTAQEIADSAPTPDEVNAERDRRMRGTFVFGGNTFDIDQGSLQRITGAATLAGFAIGQGAPAGFLRWHGGDADFGWITADNQFVAMDAPTVFSFGQSAANHESAHIFAARALKDMDPIPENFADDVWWP